jgi:hypothetical protein
LLWAYYWFVFQCCTIIYQGTWCVRVLVIYLISYLNRLRRMCQPMISNHAPV